MPTLFHYTDSRGCQDIVSTKSLWASTMARNPRDVRYGPGQYLTDLQPGSRTAAQVSRALIGHPFQGSRFSHFVEIEIAGLNIQNPRQHVFVVPGEESLDLTDRIVRNGENS